VIGKEDDKEKSSSGVTTCVHVIKNKLAVRVIITIKLKRK